MAIRDYDVTSIVKYADETTLLVKVNENETDLSQEVVNQFFSWPQDNAMACNPKKCNELILCKKVAQDIDPVNNITQVSCLKVLGVTIQSNHRFNEHIKVKLQEANKCLYVIRCLRKEGYQQPDVHYVFRSIVLPKLTYGLPIYASLIPELIMVQNFLQCRFKHKYSSYQIDIYDALEEVDRSLFKKIPVCLATLYTLPSPKQKKVQCTSEFLAINSLRLIPSVLKFFKPCDPFCCF